MCCLYTLCTANCVNFRQFSCILTIAFDGACSCIYINSNYFSYKKKNRKHFRAEQSSKMKKKSEITTQTTTKIVVVGWYCLFSCVCVCVCICLFFFCLFTLDIFFLHLLCFSSYLRMSIFFRYVSKIALSRIFSYILML